MAVTRLSAFTPAANTPYNMCTLFAPSGAVSVSKNATGISGGTTITLSDTGNITEGMTVFGPGIENITLVTNIASPVVTLSRPLIDDIEEEELGFIAATNAILRTSFISVVAVNLGPNAVISCWLVPTGEDENENNWIYFNKDISLSSKNSFETFRVSVNVGDKIFVESNTGTVNFFINGIFDVTGRANITAADQEPESPQQGDIWIDTSEVPPINNYWSGTSWEETGSQGPTGPTNSLTIGTVISGDANSTAAASITGAAPNQILNLTIKQGPTGPQGTFDIFEDAPTGPSVDEGDVWFNASDGRFYVRYDGYWVEALSNEAGPTGPTGPRGITGPAGPQGPEGVGLAILGSYPTEAELILAQPTGSAGDGYFVDGDLYVWDSENEEWLNVGNIEGPTGPQGDVGPAGPLYPVTISTALPTGGNDGDVWFRYEA
jgi:hypothetical protein